VLALAFLIGVIAGLRSLTAPAVMAWAARLGWLDLHASPLAFMGSSAAVGIFTVLAVGELIADQLPSTPSRTQPPGLIARIVTGGLSGGVVATAGLQPMVLGVVLGAAGGVAGAFAGHEARTRLVRTLGVPDAVIACLEDAVAIAGAVLIAARF
jgi:uncharacterized membrane protein